MDILSRATPPEIFKAYDIRGIVDKTLTTQGVEFIGRAIGSECKEKGLYQITIGRDGRLSGLRLSEALSRGLQSSGMQVLDIGMVTTPMLYFAAHTLTQGSGIMVTGSHNPPEYNGLKMMIGGDTLSGERIQALRARILTAAFQSGAGSQQTLSIATAYQNAITLHTRLHRPMKIIVDAGNGIAGRYAPDLYRALGCDVTELFCEVDGNFPNHHPDPSDPHNLIDLQAALQSSDAEIGLAFDGDGDRLGVVTRSGEVIFADRQLMLFADDLLKRHPQAQIIFDVKCTAHLFPWIRERHGIPILWKTGHSFIKSKMKETGALLAGEMSGHLFFQENWFGFDDGVYAGARLLEILSHHTDPSATLEQLPKSLSTPELQIKLKEGENYPLIKRLQEEGVFDGSTDISKLDGVRVEYPDGFGLARSSNTTPVIVLRFEAETQEGLQRIQNQFREQLYKLNTTLNLPF
jgi:phosphomannomutase/phosphoglucomutase